MKIFLRIFAIVALIGCGVTIFIFYRKNSELTKNLATIEANNNSLQTEITGLKDTVAGLSETTKVYCLGDKAANCGDKLTMSMLSEIDVPNTSIITNQCLTTENIYEYINQEFKTFTDKGSILFKGMFRPANRYDQEIYELSIQPPNIPVGLKTGDRITVFMNIPGIPRIPVFSNEEVKGIIDDVIILNVSNEDLRIWDQIYEDCAIYNDVGVRWSIEKFVDDNDDIIAYYPVSEKYRNIINFDPNIKDKSRLLNKGLREYIEYAFYNLKHIGSQAEAQAKTNEQVITEDPYASKYNIYNNNIDAAISSARSKVTKGEATLNEENTDTKETVGQTELQVDDGKGLFD